MGFDPVTMGAAAVVGTGIKMYGDIEAGQAEANAANYNATLAGYNAEQATRSAEMSSESGSARAAMQERETRAAFGSERARAGGGGLDPNSGSAADVQASTAELGHLDALTIRTNAAKEAYGYQTQSTNFTNEATLDRAQASQAKTASYIKAAGTLVGGASDASAKYTQYKQNTGLNIGSSYTGDGNGEW